jgi:transcriptional regulator with XRE-family HTH domain
MSVRERLNLLIKDRGMTQIALARRLGPDSSWDDWVGDRLRGRTQIKADELPMLATALGVHPCFLLTGDEIASAPSREDREPLDLDAERLYRRLRGAQPDGEPLDPDAERLAARWARVLAADPEEARSHLEYLEWRMSK